MTREEELRRLRELYSVGKRDRLRDLIDALGVCLLAATGIAAIYLFAIFF